jgi:hypothetical protein
MSTHRPGSQHLREFTVSSACGDLAVPLVTLPLSSLINFVDSVFETLLDKWGLCRDILTLMESEREAAR